MSETSGQIFPKRPWFAAPFDALPIGALLMDSNGETIFANRYLLDLFGMTPEGYMGKKFGEAFSCLYHLKGFKECGEGEHCDTCYFRSLLDSSFEGCGSVKKGVFTETFQIDGEEKQLWLEVGSELTGLDGETYALLTIVDVTKHINFDVELANARDLAESARKMKSQFLGTISHELRTPLNGIIGLSNLLMETSEDSEHQTYCKMIEESGQSLMNIVNDILDSSRLDAGLIDLHLTEFDLARHIDETVGIVLPEAYERRIELSYYVDPNLLQPVVGDPGRLRQVLLNLFSNAVKFSDPGGEVSIHVERESWNNEASRIRFAVSDHGIGIPPERQQEIFERFVQVDASNTRKYGGIGVGLAVCQQLCALMGAQIEVSSTVGIGSLFEFVLEMATGESKAELQGIPKTFLENRNVVYVGDESNRSAVLVAYLERWGANFEWSMDLNSLNSTLEHGLDTHPPILILNTGVLAEEEKESIREFLRLVERESLNWISLFDPLASIESDSKLLTHADHVLELPVSRRGLKKSLLGLLGEDHPWDNCYCKSDRVFTQAGNKEPQEESVHLKILLAEDNPIHQKVTAKMLSKLGHHVTCCRNGSEAVNELQFSPYDVLLLDCLMPEMDGYETAARVRSMRSPLRGTPIIALTSDISYENREKCKQLGMNDFLSKPVRMESLVVSLTPYTEQKASHLDWVI